MTCLMNNSVNFDEVNHENNSHDRRCTVSKRLAALGGTMPDMANIPRRQPALE